MYTIRVVLEDSIPANLEAYAATRAHSGFNQVEEGRSFTGENVGTKNPLMISIVIQLLGLIWSTQNSIATDQVNGVQVNLVEVDRVGFEEV